MQGVSINLFIKTGKKRKTNLGEIYHSEIFGKRDLKYSLLNKNAFSTIKWKKLETKEPYYFFVPKDFKAEKKYKKGFFINELFRIKAAGIKTHRDAVVIGINKVDLKNQIENYFIQNDSNSTFSGTKIKSITHRPFDNREIYYDTELVVRHRKEQIKHSFHKNYSLLSGRQSKNNNVNHFFITNRLSEMKTAESTTGSYHFQLYEYPEINEQQTIEEIVIRTPNLNQEIVNEITKKLSLTFTNEKETRENTFAPIDILDYIYAVLHSPTYREQYKEFLKIDFPRIPYPKDQTTFSKLVKLGGEIRQIHLLESSKVDDYITTYPKDGDNTITTKVGKKDWELFDEEKQLGRIWINEAQYFDNIPLTAWGFYIGGYQPAQKWLKDRKERTLEFDDILHYQKIIVALSETDRLMKEIDKIEIE